MFIAKAKGRGISSVGVAGLAAVVSAAIAGPAVAGSARLLPVPGTWGSRADGLADHDGFAWYRCWVKIPQGWPGDRWQLTLRINRIADVHEVYLNGRRVGGAGSMPPDPRSAADAAKRYTLPKDAIRSGKTNLLAIRIYDTGGEGGFAGHAPVISRYHREIVLEGSWQFRKGDHPDWAEGPTTPVTEKALFTKVVAGTSPVQRPDELIHGDSLPPEKAKKALSVADGLEIDQVLTEPEIAQPVSISFDGQGRMWVVEYRQYPLPAGLEMVSRDKYYRAKYDRKPPPPPHPKGSRFRGRDRISIHEDTDGDGTFDKHKTFVDGLNITTACVRGRGGVWVLSPPYLLFYPDRNRDDVPDSDPVVKLKGFGLEDTHSVVNSLTWGPDGWLYAAQGSTVSAAVKRPGSDKKAIRSMGQLVWRYHPETGEYEVFAEGGGNAFGIEIDARGRVYSGHNGGNTRGFHYVQGAYYRKGIDKHGQLANPYAFGHLPPMPHAQAPRFTHNFIVYQAEALPPSYRGNLLSIQPLKNRVVRSERKRIGSSFRTKDLGFPVTSEDEAFRPVDIELGPDGAVYIADFYEHYIAHGQHYQGYLDPTTGRIYRLEAEDTEPSQPPDLTKKTTRELVGFLDHPNRWVRRTANRLIGDRGEASVVPLLKKKVRNNGGQVALEALWALHVSGGLDEAFAREAIAHENPHVRKWAVRLMGDDHEVSADLADRFAALAKKEPHPEVRSQLACTAQRLSADHALPIVGALLRREEDADDPYIPLLLWWAVEAHCGADREAVVELFRDASLWKAPIVRKHILHRLTKRFAMAGTREDLLACERLLEKAPTKALGKKLLRGFEDAFQGRPAPPLPSSLVEAMEKVGGGSLAFRVRQGQRDAVRKALELIRGADADRSRRLRLIRVVGQVATDGAVSALLEVVQGDAPKAVKDAALSALERYTTSDIAKTVLEAYDGLSPDLKASAVRLLASRPTWSVALLEAVKGGSVRREAVPADVVEKMALHNHEKVDGLVASLWPERARAGRRGEARSVKEVLKIIDAGQGDPYRGKELFAAKCATCHRLFRKGGRIGPNLTSYAREDVDRLVRNIVRPSEEIREGYKSQVVTTKDGRVVTGFLDHEGEKVVVLRVIGGGRVAIRRKRIRNMKALGRSLMPAGLLRDLTDQEVRDLLAYLRSGQPLNE